MDMFQSIAVLEAERKQLDAMLDAAMDKYAEFEEGMNERLKTASPDERMALFAEREQVEEMLGIVATVERIDQIRQRIAELKAGAAA